MACGIMDGSLEKTRGITLSAEISKSSAQQVQNFNSLARDLRLRGLHLIEWSYRLESTPKEWEESALLDFIDQLQKKSQFWQQEIEDAYIEKDTLSNGTLLELDDRDL